MQAGQVQPLDKDDDVIDRDVILVWTHERCVITGADLLGHLLRGTARADSEDDSF
jgi:metal transporter CNNM